MKSNKNFWAQRPLTKDMFEYAAQDVIYLPHCYRIFHNIFGEMRKDRKVKHPEDLEISRVFDEANRCNYYAEINQNVEDYQEGDIIEAFVKNIQKFGVFCSLNLGVTGLVVHKPSKKYILENYKIGDIIEVKIEAIKEDGKKLLLRMPELDEIQQYGSGFGEPQYNDAYYDEFGHTKEAYFAPEPMINDFGEEYLEYQYYDQYYDMSQSAPANYYTQNQSYDMLVPQPEMENYYTPPDIGYSQACSDFGNSNSTTYSIKNICKLNSLGVALCAPFCHLPYFKRPNNFNLNKLQRIKI
jgi:predicted RNA-binding protein with RPS1 domain